MQLLNDTNLAVASAVFKTEPNAPFLALIVKGVFRLEPDGICSPLPLEKQVGPAPPQFHEDALGNSLRVDGETAPFKPRADCLFVGHCHAPGGIPAPAVEAEFRVGPVEKSLWIYGDRYWTDAGNGRFVSTEPEPFATMPIRNELAHGGISSQYNKHGIGLVQDLASAASRDERRIANIQSHRATHVAPDQDHLPDGLGPLDPTFEPRARLAGTYDDHWLYKRKPLPPRDFNYAYFNTARADQQVEGYLRGDEDIVLRHLHHTHGHLSSQLPGIRIRCFLMNYVEDGDSQRLDMLEAIAHLDTCVVDGDNDTVTLIWRAQAPLDPSERERYVAALISQETLAAPHDEGFYKDRFKKLLREVGSAQGGVMPPAPPPPAPEPAAPDPEQVAKEKEEADRQMMKEMSEMIEKGDGSPEMAEIVRSNTDPMTALKQLVDYTQGLVDKMPKPPSS